MNESDSKHAGVPEQDLRTPLRGSSEDDAAGKTLALLVEISKRAADQSSLDDLYFLLVNELRSVLPFDRCFLITHLGGQSSFVAASRQPALERGSDVYQQLSDLAPSLKDLDKGILLTREAQDEHFSDSAVGAVAGKALISYIRYAQCGYLLAVPFVHKGSAVGHLLYEFYGEAAPDQTNIVVLLNIAPLFASILTQQWLLDKKPRLATFLQPKTSEPTGIRGFIRSRPWVGVLVAGLLLFACMVVPINNVASGEAVVIPRQRHFAFCKIDGLIQRVLTTEGATVRKDQELATLDSTELDFKLETARRQAEILTRKMVLVRREADSTPSKLGDLRILELESQKTFREIQHIEWEMGFLAIRSPVDGIVMTKDVQTLAGKKFTGGEWLCEIAGHESLILEVFVPEDRLAGLRPGDAGSVFLNNDPMAGHALKVEEISPAAETVQRLGNVCRVRARFVDKPPDLRIGMKGVGKIYTAKTTIGSLVAQGIAGRWARFSLHF
jgi:hypothetical protein